MELILLLMAGLLLGAIFAATTLILIRRRGDLAPTTHIGIEGVAERVRSVGKLVGLEVVAKEIATSTKGWSWLPPILLSQAKIAMIFTFEKQYYVDLSRLAKRDVVETEPGRYRITLPSVEGSLRLSDVTPYDIQAGRILGLLDVIQMNAKTQKQLMSAAQDQAGEMFTQSEARYHSDARRAIGTQLETLVSMFDVGIEIEWADSPTSAARDSELEIEPAFRERLETAAA